MGSGSIYRPDKVVMLELCHRLQDSPRSLCSGGQSLVCYCKDVVTACKVDIEQETNKVAVAVLTQAIVHPRAVVI